MTQANPLGKSLTRQILIGLVAGLAVGLLIELLAGDDGWVMRYLVQGLFDASGQIFIRGLQMLVVPLVLVSLVCGAASLADPSRLGRLGGKALALYLFTTAVAISTALAFAVLLSPGAGSELPPTEYLSHEAPAIKEVIINMVPTNIINAMAQGKMLQLILFAILLGISLTLAGEPGQRIKHLFQDLNESVMQLVALVMRVAPIGVFALIAKLTATVGVESLAALADYFFLVLFVLVLHGVVTYSILIRLLGGLSPMMFLRKMRSNILFAFSTASSNATIPITLRTTEKRMGVDSSVASFTVPLGATINMDGTAIMQGIATVFIANVYGIDLSLTDLVTVVLMATMASIGAAGVPGVGLILLATVLTQVGLPVEGIGLIIGIDRLLDMTRTAVNVTGDVAVSCIVARSEGDFDQDVFDDPRAGEELVS